MRKSVQLHVEIKNVRSRKACVEQAIRDIPDHNDPYRAALTDYAVQLGNDLYLLEIAAGQR